MLSALRRCCVLVMIHVLWKRLGIQTDSGFAVISHKATEVCGFMKQLQAFCCYSLVSAWLSVMNVKATAVVKLKKNKCCVL